MWMRVSKKVRDAMLHSSVLQVQMSEASCSRMAEPLRCAHQSALVSIFNAFWIEAILGRPGLDSQF